MSKEIFDEFVDEFERDNYIVSKYKRLDDWKHWIVPVFMGPIAIIITIIVFLSGVDSLSGMFSPLPIPAPDGNSSIILITISFVAVMVPMAISLLLQRTQRGYSVNANDVAYHELTKAISAYQHESPEEVIKYLQEFNSVTRYGLSIIHYKRRKQIREYRQKMEKWKDHDEINEKVSDTFPRIFGPICEEILSIEKNDQVQNQLNEIGHPREIVGTDDEAKTADILSDVIEPFSGHLKELLLLLILSGVALAIGVGFGTEWAVVILTAAMLYMMFSR